MAKLSKLDNLEILDTAATKFQLKFKETRFLQPINYYLTITESDLNKLYT